MSLVERGGTAFSFTRRLAIRSALALCAFCSLYHRTWGKAKLQSPRQPWAWTTCRTWLSIECPPKRYLGDAQPPMVRPECCSERYVLCSYTYIQRSCQSQVMHPHQSRKSNRERQSSVAATPYPHHQIHLSLDSHWARNARTPIVARSASGTVLGYPEQPVLH